METDTGVMGISFRWSWNTHRGTRSDRINCYQRLRFFCSRRCVGCPRDILKARAGLSTRLPTIFNSCVDLNRDCGPGYHCSIKFIISRSQVGMVGDH